MSTMHNTMYTTDRAPARAHLTTTAIVFAALSACLYAVDLVPEPRTSETQPMLVAEVAAATEIASATTTPDTTGSATQTTVHSVTANVPARAPVRIEIPDIGVHTTITTPASTDTNVLDRALLSGAVQYPGSATAGENGNMLVFGHSSYLPVVKNKAYQAFNELGKLTPGARVLIYTESCVFTYAVTDVSLRRAGNTVVRFDADQPLLTLATCNTFGSKEERWVVEARLIETTPL